MFLGPQFCSAQEALTVSNLSKMDWTLIVPVNYERLVLQKLRTEEENANIAFAWLDPLFKPKNGVGDLGRPIKFLTLQKRKFCTTYNN